MKGSQFWQMHHQKLLATIQTICKQHYCQQDRDSLRMSPTLQQLFLGLQCRSSVSQHDSSIRTTKRKSQAEDKEQPKDGKVMATMLYACTPAKQRAQEMGYGHKKQGDKAHSDASPPVPPCWWTHTQFAALPWESIHALATNKHELKDDNRNCLLSQNNF